MLMFYHSFTLTWIPEYYTIRIRLIRQENNEMHPDFVNEMYRWALECKRTQLFTRREISLTFQIFNSCGGSRI